MIETLKPSWPAPSSVKAFTTLRSGGFSQEFFSSLNLALHVGDDAFKVQANREKLLSLLPSEPEWLEQTHSNEVVMVDEDLNRQADAAITREKNRVLVIMTADCLPILLCNREGTEVAAIHAGWRGLIDGVIENTLARLKGREFLAWLGPANCGSCYEVGEEIRQIYIKKYPFLLKCFQTKGSKWTLDLAKAAEKILNTLNIQDVYYSKHCSFEQTHEYFSYRREPKTGRMASLIWFE